MSFENALIWGVDCNPKSYHTQKFQRGDAQYPVSPSMLKEFIRCPRRWVDGYQSPESDAKDFGSLLDCRLLTPSHFEERYAIQPETYTSDEGEKPWSNNAKKCRAWNSIQHDEGREVVKKSEIETADAAIKRLRADETIATWLASCDVQIWVKAHWLDKATGIKIPCQCLIDFCGRKDTEFAQCLGDLKSSRSGAIIPFQRFVYQMGYHLQASFDTDLYVAATGEDKPTWCIIGQENYAPWQPFKRIITDDFKDIGRASYQHALARYAKCLKTGVWPDYDDVEDSSQGWSFCRAEPWMSFESLSQRIEDDQTETPTLNETFDLVP